MKDVNPLQEILEAAIRKEEPLFDSEWPASETIHASNAPAPQARIEATRFRPVGSRPR